MKIGRAFLNWDLCFMPKGKMSDVFGDMPGAKNKRVFPYTPELGIKCYHAIIDGMSVHKIAETDWGPNRSTFFHWVKEIPEFHDLYVEAKRIQLELMAESLNDIADNADADGIPKANLQTRTRQWLLERCAPKKYGVLIKNELTGKDGEELAIKTGVTIDTSKLSDEALRAIQNAVISSKT